MSLEDATAFSAFLRSPPSSWCGPRHRQRWSPSWRPLEGPLAPAALRHALNILKSLFNFLVSQAYVTGNPFAAVSLPVQPLRPLGSNRTLSFAQWDLIDAALARQVDTEPARRLRRGMQWLYATGLRLAEMTSAKCEDLEQVEYTGADGSIATDWMLAMVGKGGRVRQVPVPHELVDELSEELARFGLAHSVSAAHNKGIHVMARFDAELERPTAWSSSGLYQAIKAFLSQLGDSVGGEDGERLRRASSHWFRHSHASHALQGRGGQWPVPIQVVQNNLGHASIGTTSLYLTTERDERLRAMRGFWRR